MPRRAGCRWAHDLLVGLLCLALLARPAAVGAVGAGAADRVAGAEPALPQLCGYAYPAFTRFVIEDGGQDDAGHHLALCRAYQQFGGERSLGLPISRPFRVGPDLYQALEYGVLHWRADDQDVVLLDVMDLLHAAGRDAALGRLGIPPGQAPSLGWLGDPVLDAVYGPGVNPQEGLPTSPSVDTGDYVVQRFQRGVLRRWPVAPPYELAGSWTGPDQADQAERLPVGDLLRSGDLIPAQALVADAGADPQQYNWSAAPAVPATFWSNPTQAVGGWSTLAGRAGAFDVGTAGQDLAAMQAEVTQAAGLGLRLAVNGYVGRDSPVEETALDHDLSLVDTYPWGRIAAACGPAALAQQACELGPQQLDEIERQVRAHLQVTRKDDSVVAYWVLDDDPGAVRAAIELIHRLVAEDARSGRQARATICGFGGDLDDGRRALADSRAAFDAAVENFTPTGCDAVALYPYARASAPQAESSIDWSMADLLPYMLDQLRARGWDPSQQPLIGIPQTFRLGDGPAPSAATVATQAAAYCAAGASSILYYAWNDSFGGPKTELFNTPELRQGATDGLRSCRTTWSAPSL